MEKFNSRKRSEFHSPSIEETVRIIGNDSLPTINLENIEIPSAEREVNSNHFRSAMGMLEINRDSFGEKREVDLTYFRSSRPFRSWSTVHLKKEDID